MTDDDEDIYSDLSSINIVNAEPKVDEEKVTLQSLLVEKERELNEIRESKNALEKEKKTLEENISSLFKTAVNELKKKDAVIAELTRQKDAILFRRGKRHNLEETNRDVPNASQALHSKQPSIENDAIVYESAEFKSVIEPSRNHKTSQCETSSANVTTVKFLNKEDTSSDNSSVKSSTKYSVSKVDVPLKGGTEGNRERRSWSSEINSKVRYTSHSQRSSRSSYNQHSTSRWHSGETREEERSKDLSRRHNSSQEGRKRQRYDAEESYRERYHNRSHLRSPSPKRSRRESPHERYYDWKKRSSRSNYNRCPPSDSVRVAAQVKSKYSKADRERSLSRTPVKKQKCTKDVVDSSSELVGKFSVVSTLNSRNTEEKDAEIDGGIIGNNLLALPKCILDPKDIDVYHDMKKTPFSQSFSVAARARREDEDSDEGTLPLCKSPHVVCDGKDVCIPSDKLKINNRMGINSSDDSTQVKEHRYRNGVNSSVIKHGNKSKVNSHTLLDFLPNNAKIASTEKEIYDTNITEEDNSGRKPRSKNDIIHHSSLKELNKCSLRGNMSAGREVSQVPITSSDGEKMKLPGVERHSSNKTKENPRGNSSGEKKVRKTMSPPVFSIDKCTDVEQQCTISKDNLSNTPASSVDKCSGDQIPSRFPEAQEDTSMVQTPSSNRPNGGTRFRSPPVLHTPPLKGTVALKVSPSFEDPAVIKEHKFSYVVFNEQCDFHRPKRKRSIRLSGGSCGNGFDVPTNMQRKSDSSLCSNASHKEICSGKREIDQEKLANLKESPLTDLFTVVSSKQLSDDVITESETLSTETECGQKKLVEDGREVPDPSDALQEHTKQTLNASNVWAEHSNKISYTVSDTLAASLLTRNDTENIFSMNSGNLDINKETDIVSVEGVQKNPEKLSPKENLSIIKNADETCVKKENVLNPKVGSEELEANTRCVEGKEGKKKCVSSTSFHDNQRGGGGKLSEARKNSQSRAKAVSSEQEHGKRFAEKGNKVDLKANLEHRKLSLDRDALSESDAGLGFKEDEKPCSKTDTVSANETLKLERGSNEPKPKVQRTIIVSKFRRKAANFQDSPTSVLTQVKSSTKW